ncbi:MAG TPA: FAD-dependent oxidoreductase [Candidatus Egerieenecus merdigallinarum]|nr:FAD-dependent oxidoreductase [Candidatus Egerieenecus merdigallinarum]
MKRLVAGFLAVLMVLVGCVAAGAEGMTPGTYTAEAEGFHGTIKLEVTVDAEAITGIEVVEHSETAGIGEAALPVLVESVLEHQTTGVDSVAGATVTSEAFKAALTDALTQAGADMDKMSQPVEADELEAVTMEADVVVVGAGAAGLSAGLKAAQDGKNVIILEKMGVIGGASAMAGSGTMATGSTWQKEDGYEDSPEQLVEDMMENGHNKNDRATVELFANTIGEAFDWLVDENGAAVPYQRSGEPTRSYSGVGRGAGVCQSLCDKFLAEGGTLLLNTPATALIINDGAVTGVMAEGEGKAYTINAKAVVLASGGYGANDELVPDEYKAFVYAGHAGAEGDAIAMVEPLDADLINMDLINTQPNSMILPSGLGQYCNPGVSRAYAAGGFMVNQDGERFFNEQANAWDLMQAMKANDAQYLIMDQAAFDGFNAGMTGSKIYTMEDVETWLADDYEGQPVMKTAATLEELADKLGIPADALSASAQAFNEAAASGSADEFGRTPAAAQSEEGPYYALEMHIRYYASLGGLHINDGMQVLNTQQEAIPGLYAAGEVVGGLEGDVYMGGTLFGWAIASGYEAGIAAAAYTAE